MRDTFQAVCGVRAKAGHTFWAAVSGENATVHANPLSLTNTAKVVVEGCVRDTKCAVIVCWTVAG
jgi:hypothetical protein